MQKLKNRLEVITGKQVRVQENFLKVNIESLDKIDIHNLYKLNSCVDYPDFKDLEIKRSGTGLVLIVETK